MSRLSDWLAGGWSSERIPRGTRRDGASVTWALGDRRIEQALLLCDAAEAHPRQEEGSHPPDCHLYHVECFAARVRAVLDPR